MYCITTTLHFDHEKNASINVLKASKRDTFKYLYFKQMLNTARINHRHTFKQIKTVIRGNTIENMWTQSILRVFTVNRLFMESFAVL